MCCNSNNPLLKTISFKWSQIPNLAFLKNNYVFNGCGGYLYYLDKCKFYVVNCLIYFSSMCLPDFHSRSCQELDEALDWQWAAHPHFP